MRKQSERVKKRARERAKEWRKKNRAKHREYSKTYHAAHRTAASRRESYLRNQYGISVERFDEMMRQQSGACAICFKNDERLVVDHCHDTGSVRGLLCDHCNWLLGHAKDQSSTLLSAASYLKRFEDAHV